MEEKISYFMRFRYADKKYIIILKVEKFLLDFTIFRTAVSV